MRNLATVVHYRTASDFDNWRQMCRIAATLTLPIHTPFPTHGSFNTRESFTYPHQ